jgi:hypothetical protein
MATKTNKLDYSKSDSNAPPPYDSIPTSTSQSVRHRPSVFSFLNIKQKISKFFTHAPPSNDTISTSVSSADSVQCQKYATVLSRIRDIVSAPDIIDTPSVAPIVNAALLLSQLQSSLTSCNFLTSRVTQHCIGQLSMSSKELFQPLLYLLPNSRLFALPTCGSRVWQLTTRLCLCSWVWDIVIVSVCSCLS